MSAAKISISMPAEMYLRMQARMKSLGIESDSRYIQDLVRADLQRQGALVVIHEPGGEMGKAAETPGKSHAPAHRGAVRYGAEKGTRRKKTA